jgi:hypothetical protein
MRATVRLTQNCSSAVPGRLDGSLPPTLLQTQHQDTTT